VLGVSRDASAEQIRGAYRRLARQYHPDVNPDLDATRFRAVNEAYRRLVSGGREAPGDGAGPSPRSAPDPGPASPSERPEPPGSAAGPLAAASILVPLAAVVCAPGPLLFCGVLLAPVGAVLGHVARWQARRNGRPASGLALVGIVAGWALTGLLVTAIGVAVLIGRD
jgi:hypothetical protein